MTAYEEFLARKRKAAVAVGPTVEVGDVHPMLHEWQAEIVAWAVRRGRAAIFADCGLGKTFCQLEWARLIADRSLIIAPLSVARQTVDEAKKLDIEVKYVRHNDEAVGPGIWITNYEMLDHFDPSSFDAVVLDESSILKNVEGRIRQKLTTSLAVVPYRLACTATPAPNDVAELCNHAEFLGVMPRNEMLAAFFVHDEIGWRPKGHAIVPMYRWMATWATSLRKPSDLGWPDDGYNLPPLSIIPEVIDVEIEADGQLFPTELGGIGGRAAVRRATLNARCGRVIEVVNTAQSKYNYGHGERRVEEGIRPTLERGEQGARSGVSTGEEGRAERQTAGTLCGRAGTTSEGDCGSTEVEGSESTQAQGLSPEGVWADDRTVRGDDGGAQSPMRDLRSLGYIDPEHVPGGGSRPQDGEGAGHLVYAVQSGVGEVQGRPGAARTGSGLSEEAWVIWCGLNDEQDALTKAFGDRAISIYGSMSPETKEELLVSWLDGDRPILISKPSMCGFGLNLQRAHRMAFVGLSDSYEAYYQAIRRCWRFGQTEPVAVHVIVSNLERQIVDNIRRKEDEAAGSTAELVRYSAIRKDGTDEPERPAAVHHRRVPRRMLASTTRR